MHEVLRIKIHLGAKTLKGCDPSYLDVFLVDVFSNYSVQVLRRW